MITFSQPTQADADYIAANMRAADAAEVMASHNHTPSQAMNIGMVSSDYLTVVRGDGVPLGIYGLGIRDILIGEGTLWMLTTNGMFKARRELMTVTPKVIEAMLDICPRISNHVHADNASSVRWLRRLGFTFSEAMPIGVNGEMFYEFHMNRSN